MGLTACLDAIDRMRERLLYTRYELAVRDRIRRVQEAMAQDETTTGAILRAEFGGDSINGLDIKAFPEHPVKITALEKAPYIIDMDEKERARYLRHFAGSAGYGEAMNLRQDYIDLLRTPYRLDRETLRGMALRVSAVGHENTHRLQYAPVAVGWMPGAEYSTPSRLSIYFGRSVADKAMEMVLRTGRGVLDFVEQGRGGSKISDYYAEGVEIQARLHQVMVAGYTQWGKLPASRMELFAALYHAGVSTPLSVRWAMMSSAEGRQALQDFSCSPRALQFLAEPVTGINKVLTYALLPGQRAYVWNKIFPQQYGQMIEMYGDVPGRERMGLGPNPAPAIAAAAAGLDSEPLSAARAQELAAAVPVEWANQLFLRMAMKGQFTDNQRSLAAALLARPETRDVIINKDMADFERLLDFKSLETVIDWGNGEAAEMLLAAGCDPTRMVPEKWLDGYVTTGAGLPSLIDRIWYYESRIAHGEAGLAEKFNDASYRDVLRESLARIDAGLAGVVRYYGDKWMETAPQELHGLIALARDRMTEAARREPAAPAAIAAPGMAAG